MPQTNPNRTCPECSQPLGADAPQGLCPACLMQAGLEDSQDGINPTAEHQSDNDHSLADLPTREELEKLFPQLEIERLLGKGGMGAVYLARQTALDRQVALKILPPKLKEDAAFADRFAREAKAMAQLTHPNIVVIYEFGEAGGLYYLLMEYVDGVNLRQAIAGGKMAPEQALAIVPQICDALQFAHDEGIVHRDIKPENVLLDHRGRVKIADFGLAKLLNRSSVEITLTGTKQVMGTLHYMAPEQLERPAEVDHRADIYSLGVVFYELLTGHLPLGRFELPSQKVPVDARLDDVVLKTLEREPDARYQHVSEVKTEVERSFIDGSRVSSEAKTVTNRSPSSSKVSEVEGRLAPLFGTVSGWIVLISAIGMLACLLPFLVENVRNGAIRQGFELWVGQFAMGVFFVIGATTVLDGLSLKSPRLWRPTLAANGGVFIGIAMVVAFQERTLAQMAIGAWIISAASISLVICGVFQIFQIIAGLEWDEPQKNDDKRTIQTVASTLSLMGWIAIPAAFLTPFSIFLYFQLSGPDSSVRLYDSIMMFSVPCIILTAITTQVAQLAAARLRSLNSRWLGLIASALIMIPVSPLAIVGIPVGLWAIAMLSKSGCIDEFDRTEVTIEDARRQCSLAGTWMLVASVLSFLFYSIFAIILFVLLVAAGETQLPGQRTSLISFIVCLSATAALFALQWWGALALKRRTAVRWAWFAAIIALLPISPAWVISFPAGLYSLAVLLQRVEGDRSVSFLFDQLHPGKMLPAGPPSSNGVPQVQRQAAGPANALLAVGLLNILYFCTIVLLLVLSYSYISRTQGDVRNQGYPTVIEDGKPTHIEEVR